MAKQVIVKVGYHFDLLMDLDAASKMATMLATTQVLEKHVWYDKETGHQTVTYFPSQMATISFEPVPADLYNTSELAEEIGKSSHYAAVQYQKAKQAAEAESEVAA